MSLPMESLLQALSEAPPERRGAALAGLMGRLDDGSLAAFVGMVEGVGPRRLSKGRLLDAAEVVTGWKRDVLTACVEACGDVGEALGLLVEPSRPPSGFTPEQLARALADVRLASGRARGLELLVALLGRLGPLETTWAVRSLGGTRPLSIDDGALEGALAAMSGTTEDEVRAAVARSGDRVAVAMASRRGGLADVGPRLFTPLEVMQPRPVTGPPDEQATWSIEPKFRGVRVQVHSAGEGGRVALFDASGEDLAPKLPAVVRELRSIAGPVVLDGVLVARRDGTFAPVEAVRERLSSGDDEGIALVLIDVLVDVAGLRIGLPWGERQLILATLLRPTTGANILNSLGFSVAVDRPTLDEAEAQGFDGWLFKRAGSTYQPGRSTGDWLAWSRPARTLLAVVTGLEAGDDDGDEVGRCAVSVQGVDRLAGIGLAVFGLPTERWRALAPRFKALTLERYGRTRLLKPEVVVEVAYDGVRKTARAASGFQLRGARVMAVRDDVFPHEVATLRVIEDDYAAAVGPARDRQRITEPPKVRDDRVDDLPLFASRPPPKR